MPNSFRIVVCLLVGVSYVFASLPVAHAAKKKKKPKQKPAVTACIGNDMLAQVRASDLHKYNEILATAARTKNDGAILWRVSDGNSPPSYLMGTLHLSDPRVTKLSPTIKRALKISKVLALEIEDLSQKASSGAIAGAADLVVFSGDRRLDSFLSPEELETVAKKLAKLGMSKSMAPMFKPWVVSLLTAVGDCERKRVTSGNLVLDMKLAAEARKKGIPVVGIETLTSQLESAASVPMDEQVQTLRTGIAYADRANDLMETLIRLYLGRKIGSAVPFQKYLAQEAGFGLGGLAGFQREIVAKRNSKMRTRILPLLAKGNAFVAVGALHLIGDNGLVALVRDAGYDVTPVE